MRREESNAQGRRRGDSFLEAVLGFIEAVALGDVCCYLFISCLSMLLTVLRLV